MNIQASLHQKALASLAFLVGSLDISTERYSTEEAYIQALNLYLMRLTCFTVFAGVVLFAPFDFWYLANYPSKLRMLLLWRVLFGALVFLSWRWSLRHNPENYHLSHWVIMGSLWSCLTWIICTQLGPFKEPWAYMGIMVPFSSALALGTLKERFLANIIVITSGLICAVLVSPGYFLTQHALLYAAYMGLSIFLAVIAGDMYTRRIIKSYRNFSSIQKHNNSLTELVEQKAREAALLTLDAKIVEEQTRLALSRDVHDELGHLIAIHNISLYHFLTDHLDDPKQQSAAQTLISELQQIERNTHQIVKELRGNPTLENPVSLSLLEWLYAFGKETEIEFEAIVEPEDLHFDNRVAFVASQVLQEALANVQKHAEASRIEVCILQEPEQLLISIRDNGKGLNSKEVQKGAGLRSIEERLNTLNGQLELLSHPSSGTECVATIPNLRRDA